MDLKKIFTLVSLLSAGFLAAVSAQDNQRGVSLELAKTRKQLIGNDLAYSISVDIPEAKTAAIKTAVIVSFTLNNIDAPLFLDYKEDAGHLQSMKINGRSAQISLRNEHLLLDRKFLRIGKNNIEIGLFAGETAINRNDAFLYTLLVPEKARTFFPCFDQPDLKAIFSLTATVPPGWEAISNGKVAHTEMSGTQKKLVFSPSDKISTYLFSIVAGKFNRSERKIGGREYNFYYRETDTAKINHSLEKIFELHDESIKFLEAYTGIPYSFQKLDFIAIPDFQYGGMEHTGAIDYRASTLFLDQTADLKKQSDRIGLIAHETAHMWFGNLVTMKWFDDVWMKEVFANFMADKIVSNIMPDNSFNFQFLLQHYPPAYNVDRTAGTHPIRQKLQNLNQAGMLYGSIIYNKAPIVMRQLEKFIGAEQLKKGLGIYLAKHSMGNADWPDLISILKDSGEKNIDEWNDTWINSAGRPTFTYTMATQAGHIKSFNISQTDDQGTNRIWQQSFSVAFFYKDAIRIFPVTLTKKNTAIQEAINMEEPLYIIFNAGGDGYGSFPFDKKMLAQSIEIRDALMRASNYLNLYENVLNGSIPVDEFLLYYTGKFKSESEELLLDRMKKQFINIYWQYMLPEQRLRLLPEIESGIMTAMTTAKTDAKKRILFQLYQSVAVSNNATENLYGYWKSKKGPQDLALKEDDLVSLAAELAIREHPDTQEILATQREMIKDADKKARFIFLLPSLSNDPAIRDAFFASFEKEREHENWIGTALGYLHHPMRTQVSEKYLPKTLDLLQDIQSSGGIFFPLDWLSASFNYYQTENAARIVRTFLADHPGYNENLKRMILQETDDLFRVRRILQK